VCVFVCDYSEIKGKSFKFFSRGYIDVKGLGMRETYFVESLKEGEEPGLEYLPDAVRVINKQSVHSISETKPTAAPRSNQKLDNKQVALKSEQDAGSPEAEPAADRTSPEHSTATAGPAGTSLGHDSSTASDHARGQSTTTLDDAMAIHSLSSPTLTPQKIAEEPDFSLPQDAPGLDRTQDKGPSTSAMPMTDGGIVLPPDSSLTPDALKPCRMKKLPPLNKPQLNPTFPATDPLGPPSGPLGGALDKQPPGHAWSPGGSPKTEETERLVIKKVKVVTQQAPPNPPRDHLVEVKTRKCIIS